MEGKKSEEGPTAAACPPSRPAYRLAISLHRGRWRIPPIPPPFLSLAHKAYNRRQPPLKIHLKPPTFKPNFPCAHLS
ncbi:hypothetical protein B5X24_HaOG201641 [Helicoverpa armigera]|nr:hypothetical protein B5X24_HaOG201641 [Helicoverpa armigera]